MRNANVLKTVFVPYCKMVFQEDEGKKKRSKLKCPFSIKSSGLMLILPFYFYFMIQYNFEKQRQIILS